MLSASPNAFAIGKDLSCADLISVMSFSASTNSSSSNEPAVTDSSPGGPSDSTRVTSSRILALMLTKGTCGGEPSKI